MDPIAGIRSVAPAVSPTSRGATGSRPQADSTMPEALLAPAEAVSSGPRPVSGRPLATFLTHLIATAHDAPQTRRHRRAAVSEALSAYAATAARLEAASARRAMSEGAPAA
jgi:hypothetical protein